MAKWVPFDVLYWNHGQRVGLYDLLLSLVTADAPFLTRQPDVWITSETGDQQPVYQRLAKATGVDLFQGPATVTGARLNTIMSNPATLEPLGDLLVHQTDDAFEGNRNSGRKMHFHPRIMIGQEWKHKVAHWSPTGYVAHQVPSVNLQPNKAHATTSNIHGAEVVSAKKGSVFLFEDTNATYDNVTMAPLRALESDHGFTATQSKGKWPHPTFVPGKRGIDHGFIRESNHFKVNEVTYHHMPGHEVGAPAGGGHLVVVMHGSLLVKGS